MRRRQASPRRRRRWPIALLVCVAVAAGAAVATATATPRLQHTAAHPAAATPPQLSVRAAALIEESTGQSLYGLNAGAELSIASTTKLMTTLITLTHVPLGDVFADPPFSFSPADSQIYLQPGERMSVHDLVIAMLLPSADDAAEDLAYNVGHGSVSRFVAMMNARAQALGLAHTHYATPVGFDSPGNYSSAGDLVTLARFLLSTEPFFASVVRLPGAELRTGNHPRYVVNLNDLVGRYSWINGVKTGHTPDAGYVLVASGTRDGMTLIASVLGASSAAGADSAALALLNYGFASFRLATPVRKGRVVARSAIAGRPGDLVKLVPSATYAHVFPRSVRVHIRIKAPAEVTGPLRRHARVGAILVLAGRRIVARIPLVVSRHVAPPPVQP